MDGSRRRAGPSLRRRTQPWTSWAWTTPTQSSWWSTSLGPGCSGDAGRGQGAGARSEPTSRVPAWSFTSPRPGATTRTGEVAAVAAGAAASGRCRWPGLLPRWTVPTEATPARNGSGGQGSPNRSRRRGSRGGTGRSTARRVGADRFGVGDFRRERSEKENPRRGGDGPGRPGSNEEASVGEVLTLEEQGESAREFVEGLIEEIGLEAEVSVRVIDSETVEVVVEGQELGILVGRGGATLGALQELARTVVQSRTAGPTERILVDVAGYRASGRTPSSASPDRWPKRSCPVVRSRPWSRCWLPTVKSSTTPWPRSMACRRDPKVRSHVVSSSSHLWGPTPTPISTTDGRIRPRSSGRIAARRGR